MSLNRSKAWTGLVLVLLLSVAVNGYLLFRHSGHAAEGFSAVQGDIYVCPMHPQVVSDHPGDCPICGMKLVKRQAGAADSATDSLAESVHLSPSQEILANVKTEHPRVETFAAGRTVPGRIVVREESQWKAGARVMGRVDRLYVATPGQSVTKGQPLYDLFSPDLAGAQRELILATRTGDEDTRDILLGAARNKLRSLGMEDTQIEELESTGQIKETLTFHAPAPGVLMNKMTSEGEWVMPGMTLLEFADLSEVWAEGTLYETDLADVHLEDRVEVRVISNPDLKAEGTVSFLSPMLDMMTRTLNFRVTLANPDLQWKPEMFVEIRWRGQHEQQLLSVSDDAVLATGRSNRVWVKVGEGRYQPREVQVGPRQNGRVAILSGLQPTDEVVASGGYLIDSDAQIKNMPMENMKGMEGMKGNEGAKGTEGMPGMPGMSHESEPEHSMPGSMQMPDSSMKSAKRQSAAKSPSSPVVYTCPMHPEVISDHPGRCPKCGMNLVKKER